MHFELEGSQQTFCKQPVLQRYHILPYPADVPTDASSGSWQTCGCVERCAITLPPKTSVLTVMPCGRFIMTAGYASPFLTHVGAVRLLRNR